MDRSKEKILEKFYPLCRSMLGPEAWNRILEGCGEDAEPEAFPDTLAREKGALVLAGFFPELARLEWNFIMMGSNQGEIPAEVEKLGLNPTLRVFQLSWKNLPLIIRSKGTAPPAAPEPGEEPRRTTEKTTLDVLEQSRQIEKVGFLWLFGVGGLFLVRLLLDPTMARRPLLEPNLTAGGLTFIGCSLFVFLMANVITSKPASERLINPLLITK